MRPARMSWGLCCAQKRRLVLGVVVLLIVDVIWVASSELTVYVFVQQQYSKPFFSTFVKTSMFILYLLGFLFWKPWRQQCAAQQQHGISISDTDSHVTAGGTENGYNNCLSEPLYVPVKFQDVADNGVSRESKTRGVMVVCVAVRKQRVRFSNVMEVRELPHSQALEAKLSRMSHAATSLRIMGKRSVSAVAKISFFFCFVWFLANLAYQEALTDTQVAIVNIVSSTSGLFTLILASIFPSNSSDRFTLSKLLAVILSMVGVAVVSFSGMDSSGGKGIIGSLWSLLGAMLYAVYIVMLKRKVDREEKLDIPMFFGFVGLFSLLLLWPGFVLLHYSRLELFEMPNRIVISYILINGLIGTVLSEFLWLWGCFLTSSLIGTLALSLTIPLSILTDMCLQKTSFSWLFFVGAVPVFLSFFLTALLSHYNNWDPAMVALRRVFSFICRKHRIHRARIQASSFHWS
ncbi:solute carrier family 35 member F5 isoform X3 [Tachysurus fulvidraco]|uniref:solute carrier family 35 member F5 isoform X3 n=1 Tax=Tachysurus fulvidraco TaxID=1234273 RepID=UPI001FF06A3F|nr:solute carrier family 35 member F5 isoform X3 [Tachysurus fulvidraco]